MAVHYVQALVLPTVMDRSTVIAPRGLARVITQLQRDAFVSSILVVLSFNLILLK